ncbi:hypothetical protein M8C21_007691, partial [Ambrosia artemisiifolia]
WICLSKNVVIVYGFGGGGYEKEVTGSSTGHSPKELSKLNRSSHFAEQENWSAEKKMTEKVMKGIFCLFDLLFSFHTCDYARHFVSACTWILGLEGTPKGVEDQGRLTHVVAFPIGSGSED